MLCFKKLIIFLAVKLLGVYKKIVTLQKEDISLAMESLLTARGSCAHRADLEEICLKRAKDISVCWVSSLADGSGEQLGSWWHTMGSQPKGQK